MEDGWRKVAQLSLGSAAKYDGPLDSVGEFANVPRPRVVHEPGKCLRRESLDHRAGVSSLGL
jgi:hypothetical protein